MTSPKIYGLIGYPVKHSLSPFMHNAAFNKLEISAEYRLFEVKPEELEVFLGKIISSEGEVKDINGNLVLTKDIQGLNITIPHKVKAREILEKKFPLIRKSSSLENEYYAAFSGAVNTLKKDGRELYYFNTDASGFLRSLKESLQFEPKGKNVLVIGCGGAGRAVIASLSWKNEETKKIYVYESNPETVNLAKEHFFHKIPQAEFLKDKIEFISKDQIPEKIKSCQLLVNASPVGMDNDNNSIIEKGWFHKELYVYDVVYNRETNLVRQAKEFGVINAVNGLGMLLYQGVDAFEHWLGQKAPIDEMREALEEAMRK